MQAKINSDGRRYIAGLQATAAALWQAACKADGVEPTESFVVFSPENRAAKLHDVCRAQLAEAQAAYRAGGYVGLRTR